MSHNKKECQQTVMDAGNWTAVPNQVLNSLRGNSSAFMVYFYLLSNAEGFHPSQRVIAEKTGLSRTTVQTALEFLEKQNLVLKIHGKTPQSKVTYKLVY
jgi:DNA-binding MarR family transcriptional regulator